MSRFGEADRLSDLDLIIVAESGQCDALWEQRSQISELVHGGPVVWSQEPSWQRPYRYQTWDEDLIELDLLLNEHLIRRSMPYVRSVRRNPYLQVRIRRMSRLCA